MPVAASAVTSADVRDALESSQRRDSDINKWREVKRGVMDSVLRMIAQKARDTHEKLPWHVRHWYSVEDLQAEGVALASTKAARMWQRKGPALFTTYLYKTLDNHYSDVLTEQYAEKRRCGGVYSIDSTTTADGANLGEYLLEVRKIKRQPELDIVTRIDAEKAFVAVYSEASYNLRKYLVKWMLQPSVTKFKLDGAMFLEAKKEFRRHRHSLSRMQAVYIQTDERCRKNIALALVRGFRSTKRSLRADQPFCDCLESELIRVAARRDPLMTAPKIRYFIA